MQDRTPDEVLKEEQAILGTEQGNIFNTLKNNIFWLEIKWKEYQTLYENNDNIAVLNKTAPFYFYMIHQIIIDDILLHINKIASPKGNTYKYLSIIRLPEIVKPKYRDELKVLVDNAVTKAKFVKDRRDRYIAHYSLALTIDPQARPLEDIKHEDIENVIEAFKKIIVYIYSKVLGSALFPEVIYPLENANALLRRLKQTI
jgi:hypothetical protein